MNRKEFIETLEKNLKHSPETIEEIISDFNEYFDEATREGKSESEICKILGDPIEIINNFNEEIEGDNLTSREYKEEVFISILSGSVILDYGYSNEYNVKILNSLGEINDERIKIYEENGGLYIKEERMDFIERIMSVFKHRKVYVSVPQDFKGSIYIKTISGNIRLENIDKAENIECRVISGNIKILNVSSEKGFNISSKSGNILLTDCIGDSILDGKSGNISVKKHKESVSASTISGNINVETNIISRESIFETKSGGIKLNIDEILNDIKINCISGNIKFRIDNILGSIIAKTKSGNVIGSVREKNNAFFILESSTSKNAFGSQYNEEVNGPIVRLSTKSGVVKVDKH